MKLQYIILSLLFSFSLSNCVKIPGENSGPGKTDLNPWVLVDDLVSEQLILNAKSNGSFLYVISEGEYFSLDQDLNIKENFIFRNTPKTFGTPAFSDNVFVRVANDGNDRPDIEFRATKNPSSVITFNSEDIGETPDESLEVDQDLASEIGAFNFDNTQFLLATISRPKFEYKLVRFKVTTDASTFNIEEVKVDGYADLKQVDVDPDGGAISSIRYFEGEFFVATREGTFRVTKDMRLELVSPFWSLDIFRSEGDLYTSSFNAGQMMISEDNGRTFEQSSIQTDLGIVRVRGPRLISQGHKGQAFSTPKDTDNIFDIAPMQINEALRDPSNGGLFRAFEYFSGKYYFSVGKELYFADDITAEE